MKATAAAAMVFFVSLGAAGYGLAQEHDHSAMPKGEAAGPSTKAFIAANAKMHADMQTAYTGDADVDFVTGMIPHHQGAVDMAKIVIEHGRDPEIRKLAEEVIKAQETEIAFMRAWLARRSK